MPQINLVVDEIGRQHQLVWRERHLRIGLSVLGLAMTALYLPVIYAISFAIANTALEYLGLHMMRGLDPRKTPWRYRFVLLIHFLMEVMFVLPCAMIWQMEKNYGQTFAIGLVLSSLMQIATVRSIHLPFGLASLAGATFVILFGNAIYWINQDDWIGLLISNIGALGGLGYTLTVLISNNRLHRSSAADRSAALAGDRAKSRFLAQMSHELRTPLNAILGMGHAELRRNKDALSQKRLSVLIASAEGLSTILDDILDMSSVQVGRLPIRSRPAIPRDEILATLGLFQPGIDAADLHLKAKIAPELGDVALFDTQRLRQCVSNLMSNALKHTKQGEIRVAAELRPILLGDRLLQITVSDTGPGIPDELHSSVFEPFFLNRDADNFDGGYTSESNGLGLSICRAMARQMGGDVVLLSNQLAQSEGSGATFILTLQLGTAPDGAKPVSQNLGYDISQPEQDTNSRGGTETTAGLRVLVVDDIATNRLVASTYLRMIGAAIIEAESGDAALKAMGESLPDLVLLDMNMPGMNGHEMLIRLRELPGAAGRIPVIAMTADSMEQYQELYDSNMLDGYLAKPINPTRIENEIRSVMKKTRDRQARPSNPTV
jgi:signal transduction histidine kinase/CheY-like chemotaxis protein